MQNMRKLAARYGPALLLLPLPLTLSSCAGLSYTTATRANSAPTVAEAAKSQPRQNKGGRKELRLPPGDYGDVIAVGDGGEAIVAAMGRLLLSHDNGQSWRALEGASGDHLYTTDGGVSFLSVAEAGSSVDVKALLCNVERATFTPRGRLYLRTQCEHSAQLWSVKPDGSGPWHVRAFTHDERAAEEGFYSPGLNLVSAGNRVLIDADTPRGQVLLSSDDEGKTWYPLWSASDDDAGIVGLDFLDEAQGWMLQGDGRLLRTSDGGRAWRPVSTLPAELPGQITAIDFVDAKTGVAVGQRGLILRTDDGGHTWQEQTSGVSTNLFKVAAAGVKRFWAVGQGGLLLETDDGGVSWRRIDLGVREDVRGLTVKDKVAWLVVKNRVYRLF